MVAEIGPWRARETWRDAAIVGVAHFAAALLSLALTRWSNGLASVWVPNAILLAYLIDAPRARWLPAALAVALSGTVANLLGGAPGPLGPLFGATNGLEPLLVAWLLARNGRGFDVERVGDLVRFALAAAGATALSASIAAGAGALLYAEPFLDYWLSWFSSSFLGLAIATPLFLIIDRQLRGPGLTASQFRESVAVLSLVGVVGLFVFAQRDWSLTSLLAPPITLATFRLRAFGAAASVLLVAVIGTAAVTLGAGPAAASGASFSEQMVLLQLFLAVAILTVLPVAAILSKRDRIELSLARREADLAMVLDSVSDVIFRTDIDGRWTYLNPAWETRMGLAVEESLGQSVVSHIVEEDRAEAVARIRELNSGLFDSVRHQYRFRTASGEHRWGEVQARRLLGPDGEMVGSAGIIVDISDRLALAALADDARRQAEREAEAALLLAATDELTGVASRRAFLSMLNKQLASERPLALALFDIDHFKRVNDQWGHAVGDEVLARVAEIAEGCVREGDLIGRLGGEEFAIAMPGASVAQAAAIGDRVRRACAEARHRGGVRATVSVGVAAAISGMDAAALLAQADAALYRAKAEGRNRLETAA